MNKKYLKKQLKIVIIFISILFFVYLLLNIFIVKTAPAHKNLDVICLVQEEGNTCIMKNESCPNGYQNINNLEEFKNSKLVDCGGDKICCNKIR